MSRKGKSGMQNSGGIEREALSEYYRSNGFEVDSNGNVTLYHATPSENTESIMKNGFVGTNAPLAAYVQEEVGPRSFFSLTKQDVWDGNGSEGYDIIKVKVPAEYVRQAGKSRPTEVYVEGNLKNRGGGIWKPDVKPTSTVFDRMIVKRYKKKVGK